MIRRAETRADFAAHAATWNEIWQLEPISVEFVLERVSREPERLYLLAEDGGRVVGTGVVGRSSRRYHRPAMVAVRPEWRRRGVGSELLARCLGHAESLHAVAAIGSVREDDTESLRFLERRGYAVTDRVVLVELALQPGVRSPRPPDGIDIVELDEGLLRGAYEVFREGAEDIPSSDETGEVSPFDEWVLQLRTHPLTLVALDAGRVVGYADLELRNAEERLLENNLTSVRRSHRRRGIAEALKRTQIAWAAANGFRRVTTGSHEANEPMRRLNEKLGYRELPALLDVTRPL